jgi:hypothetical protein
MTRFGAALVVLAAAAMVTAAVAGPAGDAILAAPTIEAECAYLMRECELGRAARAVAPGWVEYPPGVGVGTASPEATRHIGNAVEASAAMRVKHGFKPACVRECDDLLQR